MHHQNIWKPIKDILLMEIRLFPKKDATARPPSRRLVSVFSLEGQLRTGNRTTYSLQGEDFALGTDTFVLGVPRIGASARVKGVIRNGGEKIATSMTIIASC